MTQVREPATSPIKDAWLRLAQNRAALAGLILLVTILLACLVGPFVSPYAYEAQDLTLGAVGPCEDHWLGTDKHGRDLFTRILYGGRMSFAVGFAATFVALGVGVAYGMLSGYLGGWVDRVLMRIVDIIYALPFVVFVILLMVMFERSMILMFVAIGMVEWLTMARIVRGQVLSLKIQAFVQASHCMGQGHLQVMSKHLLPNILGVIIIYATLTIPNVMLLEAFISFLGMGVQAPDTSWGDLIKEGADVMETQWWRLVFPALFFAGTLFSLNFLGDGLQRALDPRSRN